MDSFNFLFKWSAEEEQQQFVRIGGIQQRG